MSAPEFRLSAFLERATPSAASSAGLLAKPSRRLFFPIFGRADDDVEQLQLAAQNGDGSFQDPASSFPGLVPKTISRFWILKTAWVETSK
jgi:hypothetical protein